MDSKWLKHLLVGVMVFTPLATGLAVYFVLTQMTLECERATSWAPIEWSPERYRCKFTF